MGTTRVAIAGDELVMSYHQDLRQRLEVDGIELLDPVALGQSSGCAERLHDVMRDANPDIGVLGCTPIAWENREQMLGDERLLLSEYERDLASCLDAMRGVCGNQCVFVTAPPIHPERFRPVPAGHEADDVARLLERRLAQVNEFAIEFMGTMNVMVAPLYREISKRLDASIEADGLSLTESGRDLAARVVSEAVFGVMHS